MTKSTNAELPQISVTDLIAAIKRLAPDAPYARRGGQVYTTKEQWIGWLAKYDTPGHYKRSGTGYDARFAYNHVQNHHMLLWLIGAGGIETPTLSRAAAAAEQGKSMAQKAAAVRKLVPWNRAVELLWPIGV